MLINIPTRFAETCKSSLLDHVYTNMTNESIKSGVCIFEISDHFPTFFIAHRSKILHNIKTKFRQSMKQFKLEDFLLELRNDLSNLNLKPDKSDVNQDVINLTTVFNSVLDRHAPMRQMSRKEKRLTDKPWITKGILISIKTKNRLYKKYFKNKNDHTDNPKREFYKKYLNKLTHIKNLAKRTYYEKLLKTNYKNPSKTGSIIREIVDHKNSYNKSNLPPVIPVKNEIVRTDSLKFLECLCEFFTNIGRNMSNNLPFYKFSFRIYNKSCLQSFVLQEITTEDVSNAIDSIKSHSAPGKDEISPKFVKLAKCILSPYLANLFNKCIDQDVFPFDFKIAYVIPIPKTSSPKSLDEFRRISLLSVFSKLFEKILEKKMSIFIAKKYILTPFQFGFRENNSTELAITTFYDKLLKNLDENKITCSIFLDLKKAFDSVNHEILLQKLYHYGFRGKMFKLLASYLSERYICVKIDGKVSSSRLLDHGVPQGSILGPLLFLFYINDLPNASNFETTLFADDTNLHLSHININSLQSRVQQEMMKVSKWMISNKLTLNYKKSCYMLISKNLLMIQISVFS